ncbi:flagellar biosynthetic protein FliO [Halomonas salifodinae]|uniref:flagellar biosynthetic protein FliO n=1 Tax=Halomonas salifodinae TaxID=438745 RepID=UPI0033B61D47
MSSLSDTGLAGGEALVGLATLGKTAAALALVLGLIFLSRYLLTRLGPHRHAQALNLRVVASTALGPKERVVVVEVDDTWLVLGVGGGRITPLHQLPARETTANEALAQGLGTAHDGEPGFGERFAAALKHNGRELLRGKSR